MSSADDREIFLAAAITELRAKREELFTGDKVA
jgi:hypothetical protein